ncbi:MAG: hypothetical protein ACI91G_000497 [Gammaproteobacteria bacterium]|jgi:uncharacterized protein (DUF2164 family)
MTINISKEARNQIVDSIQAYFDEEMEEPVGNLVADALLDFFVKEVGPSIYNQAIRDAQTHMLARVNDLDLEIFQDEFQYSNT